MNIIPELDSQRRLGLIGWSIVVAVALIVAWAMYADLAWRSIFG